MKYLLHGCRVVTMNARRDILDADILVDGDRIAALGPDIAVLPEARDAERVDMTGRVLLPGLIQAHMHVTQILFRGLCDDLELMDWLEKSGEADNTIIIFMSDNGGLAAESYWRDGKLHTQNHPLNSGKGSLYDRQLARCRSPWQQMQ